MEKKYNKTIEILYGSNTGNSENVAFFVQNLLTPLANSVECHNVYDLSEQQSSFTFQKDNMYILCTSTWGIEPATLQDDFEIFWENIVTSSIEGCSFILLALGDVTYPYFAYASEILSADIVKYKGNLLLEPLKIRDPWEDSEKDITSYFNKIFS